MTARKVILALAMLIWSTGLVWAGVPAQIEPDQWTAWLAQNKLHYQNQPFGHDRTLYSFSEDVKSFELFVDNSRYFLAYEQQGTILITRSLDNGVTFSSPEVVASGEAPSLLISDRDIWLAWTKDNIIRLAKSEDAGQTFSQRTSVYVTGEALSSPQLLLDDQKRLQLVFLSQDPNIHQHKVNHQTIFLNNSQLTSSEVKVLFTGYDDLVNLKIKQLECLLITWQMEYLERRQSYFCASLDSGKNFSEPRQIDFERDLLALDLKDEKLEAFSFDHGVIAQEIDLPVLPAPEVTSVSNHQLVYLLTGNLPLICQIELGDQVFEQLVLTQSTEGSVYDLPEGLSDGVYSLRLRSFDGLRKSQFSNKTEFIVDTIAPEFISFESERKLDQLHYQGQINELPASLMLNNAPLSLEVDGRFIGQYMLEAGTNILNYIISDEAGNFSITTLEVFYNPASPEITVISPTENDWFKPESNIVIEARIHDLQSDILDGATAQLILNGQVIEDELVYDQADNSLFGFISLPDNLSDGQHFLIISLTDRNGDTGSTTIKLNIDGTAPTLTALPSGRQYSNSGDSSILPLIDQGAGLDLGGTIITIDQLTSEGTVSQEGEELILSCRTLLSEGSHEVELSPRDMIGNIGEIVSYSLIIDLTAPMVTLTGTYESPTNKNKILVQGSITEPYPDSIRILNNRIETNNSPLNSTEFAIEVPLKQGNNDIQVEVTDQAGNKTIENIQIFAMSQDSSQLITSFLHGPNPFSPAKKLPGAFSTHGKGMIFSYSLVEPADIKIRVYDITGTLVWIKSINSATSGVTAWSGEDQFGQISPNGVYPYFFTATGNGRTETRRGKIIINQ